MLQRSLWIGFLTLLPLSASAMITVSTLFVEGVAYTVDVRRGVETVDVSDPSQPVRLLRLDLPALAVTLIDDTAYVATEPGLEIFDVSNSAAPRALDRISLRTRQHVLGHRHVAGLVRQREAAQAQRRGILPVAILGAETLDVSTLDETTLRLGPDQAAPAHAWIAQRRDANGDGRVDLVTHFRLEETGLATTDRELCITGRTRDGRRIQGCDSLRSVGP